MSPNIGFERLASIGPVLEGIAGDAKPPSGSKTASRKAMEAMLSDEDYKGGGVYDISLCVGQVRMSNE